jgi:hypothetical protein
MIPGASCLATIGLSLRDKIHLTAEALLLALNAGPPQPAPITVKVRSGDAGSKETMHLTVLHGMTKETSVRYQSRLNILGCFLLLHALRTGKLPKPLPIRRN